MNKSMMQHSAHGALMIGHGSAEEFSMASSSSMGSVQRDSSGSSSQLYAMSSSSSTYCSDRCSNPLSGESSPCNMSPWHHSVPPGFTFDSSNWSQSSIPNEPALRASLLDSLVREEGHIYSIASARPLLYTGSDSKNIRVWKDQTEYSAFKSSSGLVKAIIIIPGRILTGHQDGKIRLWRISSKDPAVYKRAGSLPRLKDLLKYSLKPSSYVEVRRRKTALWIRHCDAVSCLSFSHEDGLLYSGSWDRTFKAWRITDSKCLESIVAHEDAINAVIAAGFDAIVLTGSADGTVKVWRREMLEGGSSKVCRHKHVQTLLKQDSAVTALAINAMPPETVYSSSSDGAINFWEWNGEKKSLGHGGVLRGHKQAVLCLTAAGRLVLSGSADKTIWVWRREGAGVHSCLAILSGHAGPVKCLAVHEEEDDRCCDGINGGSSQQEYAPGKDAPKVCRRFVLYSGSLDKSVKVWQILELQPPNGMVGIPYF